MAGQTSVDAEGAPLFDGDMRGQVTQSVDNLEAVLKAAGMALSDIVQLRIFVTDMDALLANYDAIAARLGAAGVAPPVSVLEIARMAIPSTMFEIEAVAAQ